MIEYARSLGDRAVDFLFKGIVAARVQRALQESTRPNVSIRPTSAVKDDAQWRRLSSGQRDLSPLTHDQQREIAVFLWTYNPLARRIINAMVEYVVGEGVQIQADNTRTRDYLQSFWDDPGNRWDLRLEERVRELWLMGEQFWPAFSNQFSGLMRLGVLDPSRVRAVIMDPDNAMIAIGVITKSLLGNDERRYKTILAYGEEDVLSTSALAEREKFTDGEMFTAAVNRLSTQTRGLSELFALADWMDGYEQLLFAQLNQERARASYLWDVTLTGASKEEIDERLTTIQPPKPFSLRVHNEKEEWKLVGPDAATAQNNDTLARLFRNHTLGGAGIPEHWYGGGGDVNRATADSMSSPTEKAMSAKQRTVKYILHDVLSAQLERGIAVGVLPDRDSSRAFDVIFPELSTRDLSRVGAGLQQVAAGLSQGIQDGLVSRDVAARVLSSMISNFGVEVDAEEMLAKAQEELAARPPAVQQQPGVPQPPNAPAEPGLAADLVASIDEIRESVDDLRNAPREMPTINVDVTMPPVNVEVPQAVPQDSAPITVTVEAPPAGAKTKTVRVLNRDAKGRPESYDITES